MKTLPLHMQNRELIEEARKAFRPSAITPDTSMEKIMFEAGSQKVIDWLDNRMTQSEHQTTVTSPKEDHELPDNTEGFLRRVMAGSS